MRMYQNKVDLRLLRKVLGINRDEITKELQNTM
jgi:hypothetical protein